MHTLSICAIVGHSEVPHAMYNGDSSQTPIKTNKKKTPHPHSVLLSIVKYWARTAHNRDASKAV